MKICLEPKEKYQKLDSKKIKDNYVSLNFGNKFFNYDEEGIKAASLEALPTLSSARIEEIVVIISST